MRSSSYEMPAFSSFGPSYHLDSWHRLVIGRMISKQSDIEEELGILFVDVRKAVRIRDIQMIHAANNAKPYLLRKVPVFISPSSSKHFTSYFFGRWSF